MKSYKLYIFDFDDTLVLTHRDVLDIHYPQLANKLKIRYLGEDVAKNNWGRELSDSLNATFEGNTTTEQMLTTLNEIYDEIPITPVEGVNRILKILKKHHKFICIASSGDPSFIKKGINKSLKMKTTDFDYIYSTVENRTDKPSSQIISLIKQKYEKVRNVKINNRDIIYIGDSLVDYLTAKNGGADFLGVTTGIHSKLDFLKAGLEQNKIFENLRQMMVPLESHGIVALVKNNKGEYLLLQEARKNNPYYGAWSGPHGKCLPEDILEEESVVRETHEECDLLIKPVCKVYERSADTKIKTVAFWKARPIENPLKARVADTLEILDVRWASIDQIRAGKFELYPGTQDYFFNHLK